MRVAAQVAEQLGGFAEGWLGVNDPLLSLQSMQQPGKQFPVLESGGRAAAVEPSVPVEVLQSKDELVAEDGAEHRDRQQEARGRMYPALVVGRQAAGRNDAVGMWLNEYVLAPGVQDAEEDSLGVEGFWLCRLQR